MGPDRILILSNFFTQGHGGAPESVLLLARELAVHGVEVDVSCASGLLRNAQNLNQLPATASATLFSRETLDLARYGALLVAGSWVRHAPLIVLRAALNGISIVYAAKGCLCRAEFERLRDMRRIPYFLLVEWLPFFLARKIVFSSRWEQRACVIPTWLWQRRAVVVPEPFRGDGMETEPAHPGDDITLGFLAEIAPRKGLLELIAAFGDHLAAWPGARIRLVIGGQVRRGSEAYLESCRALAQNNGAAAHIEWCGPVRGEQRRDFYRSLDMFMCPSRFESFGLTPLEALWQGIPVCAGPAMGVLEHLQTDVPVLRLPSLDSKDIAQAIATLAGDRSGWRGRARLWKGRPALTRTNADISKDFLGLLLDDMA